MLRNVCSMRDEGGKTSSLKFNRGARLDSQRGRAGMLKQPQVPCHITPPYHVDWDVARTNPLGCQLSKTLSLEAFKLITEYGLNCRSK
jgi:hypothetical protein